MEFISPEEADNVCREIAQNKKRMRAFKIKDDSVLIKYRGNCERLIVPYGIEELTSDSFGKLPRAAYNIDKKRAKFLSPVREVVLPSTLRRIASDTFCGMPNLERITISNKSDRFRSDEGILTNADRTMLLCYPRALDRSEYVLPDALEYVPERAFYRCKNLTRVRMGENTRAIKASAFEDCPALREAIFNPSLKEIDMCAFSGCTALNGIVLPRDLMKIGEEAFMNCAVQELDIPSGVKQIDPYAFSCCTKLKKVVFHSGLKTICSFAFEDCFSLEEALLPDGLHKIESYAFDCPSLKRVFIPASVTEMGDNVFTSTDETCVITIARETMPDEWSASWCDNSDALLIWDIKTA